MKEILGFLHIIQSYQKCNRNNVVGKEEKVMAELLSAMLENLIYDITVSL